MIRDILILAISLYFLIVH